MIGQCKLFLVKSLSLHAIINGSIIGNESPKHCTGEKITVAVKLTVRYIYAITETEYKKIQKQRGTWTNIDIWWSNLLDLSCWVGNYDFWKYTWNTETNCWRAASIRHLYGQWMFLWCFCVEITWRDDICSVITMTQTCLKKRQKENFNVQILYSCSKF